MTVLILGLLVFIGIHLVPTRPALRESLVTRLGENAYKGVFSLLVLTGLGLIIYGKGVADTVSVWQPDAWTRTVPTVLMLPALVLLVVANMPARIRCHMRHPMMTGVLLWAVAHLVANGDRASILLFGSFAIWSVYSMVSANRRGAALLPGPVSLKMDLVALVIGVLLYGLLFRFHGTLFGMPLA